MVVFVAVAAASTSRAGLGWCAPGQQRPVRIGLPGLDFEAKPECGTVRYSGESLEYGLRTQFALLDQVLDAVLPDFGIQYDTRAGTGPVLGWPFVLPFGKATGTTVHHYHCEEDLVYSLKPHRLVLEPGVTLASQTVGWLRPGYSFVWHPERGKVGFSVGLGSTLSLHAPTLSLRASASPELGIRYGACCDPMYWLLSVRYDLYFAGERAQAALLKLGISCW
jgi:hypothetical protein